MSRLETRLQRLKKQYQALADAELEASIRRMTDVELIEAMIVLMEKKYHLSDIQPCSEEEFARYTRQANHRQELTPREELAMRKRQLILRQTQEAAT